MIQKREGGHLYIGPLPGKGRRMMGDGVSHSCGLGEALPRRGAAGEQGQETA